MPEVQVVPGQSGEDFISVLVQLKGGTVIHQFGDQMSKLVAAVVETGKSGSLTLVLKVNPLNSDSAALTVEAEAKLKIPQPSLGKTVFFPNETNQLVRFNPKQMALAIERQEEQ